MKKHLIILISFLILFPLITGAVTLEKLPEFKPVTLYLASKDFIKRMAVYSEERAKYFFSQGYKLEQGEMLGTTITTINANDTIKDSRTTINNNFTALNNGKIEISTTTLPALTTLANLATVGTITSGTWRGTAIEVGYNGTGTTSPTTNQVILGNGASGFKVVSGFGTSGQLLQSQGASQPPIWVSTSVDEGLNYDWTGLHTWTATTTFATSTIASTTIIQLNVSDKLAINSSATSTLQNLELNNIGTPNATTTLFNNVAIKGNLDLTGLSYTGIKWQYISNTAATTTTEFGVALPADAKAVVMNFRCINSVDPDLIVRQSQTFFKNGYTNDIFDLNVSGASNSGSCRFTTNFSSINFTVSCAAYSSATCQLTSGLGAYFYK